MTERPILFSGPMVRAILEGRKTQTRRVIPTPLSGAAIEMNPKFCRHGVPGDRLWVRETFFIQPELGTVRNGEMGYVPRVLYKASKEHVPGPWKPSIHLPRWASRITLEITNVRVQRLQDISEEDAQAEGVYQETFKPTYRTAFGVLWDSINAKRGFGWETNPWVWAITFPKYTEGATQ